MQRIPSSSTFPERQEKHLERTWHDLSFNHKTTATMGLLVPLAVKEVNPGETVRLQNEIMMRFAPMFLPIMHQVYFTLDWFYVTYRQLWPTRETPPNNDYLDGWEDFIKQVPSTGGLPDWAYFQYKRADAVSTECILNYMGFNAPPGSGTLIFSTNVSALPVAAYVKIWDEYFRNDQIQNPRSHPLVGGDNTSIIESMWNEANSDNLECFRRNWPRDYYTSATPTPQLGAAVLIPSYSTDPLTGLAIPQNVLQLDGQPAPTFALWSQAGVLNTSDTNPAVLQLSSTIRDFRYAAQMTEYLERTMRAGDRYRDFIKKNFDWDPNPLFVDRPLWIGGYTGNVVVSEVLATAESTNVVVGNYAGKAIASGTIPMFTYTCPDYGVVMCLFSVYPKASYYSGLEKMWTRSNKMDYLWEQFAQIGDQALKNKEVWFSWYDADIAWNEQTFGYLPIYAEWRYSNDIVSGQMRTIWQSFHLGRQFTNAASVVLNQTFLECRPDIGRVFVVDAEAGEHEIYIHAYNRIQILRRLGRFGLPQL